MIPMIASNWRLKDWTFRTSPETWNHDVVGLYASDLLSNVLRHAEAKNALVTTLSNMNVIAVASLANLPLVIFSEGQEPSEAMVEKANEEGVALLVAKEDSVQVIRALLEANLL